MTAKAVCRFLIPCALLTLTACSSSSDSKPVAEKSLVSTSTDTYLDEAAKEPGAVKTASGLVYRELTPGTGASPKETDSVTVNYKGTLTNGTQFDANNGISFPLNGVIPCWTEGVQKMKVGGKSKLVCPASIAYGNRDMPGIPAGSTLVFEVDLIKIGG